MLRDDRLRADVSVEPGASKPCASSSWDHPSSPCRACARSPARTTSRSSCQQPDKPAGRGGQLARAGGEGRRARARPAGDPAEVGAHRRARAGAAPTRAPSSRSSSRTARSCRARCSRRCRAAASTSTRSLLPKYRGAAPVQWAVIDGERRDRRRDHAARRRHGHRAGAARARASRSIRDETSGELLARLAPIGAAALLEALAAIAAGTAHADARRITRARPTRAMLDQGRRRDRLRAAGGLGRRADPRRRSVARRARDCCAAQTVKLFRARVDRRRPRVAAPAR